MAEAKKRAARQPGWAQRGATPKGTRKQAPKASKAAGSPPRKATRKSPTSSVRSLAKETNNFSSKEGILKDLSSTIETKIQRLARLEETQAKQMVAEMDVNIFGFSVLARWKDMIIAHTAKTLWQQTHDMAHEIRDPLVALETVSSKASELIIQNRVGEHEDIYHDVMSVAFDTGRRDFVLDAKALRDKYQTK